MAARRLPAIGGCDQLCPPGKPFPRGHRGSGLRCRRSHPTPAPFVAQLWRRVDETVSDALGEPTAFRTGSSAGYLASLPTASVPVDVEPGSNVQLQLRVWDAGIGTTYDAAVAAGARAGVSPWFLAVTGTQASPGNLRFLETLTLAGDWAPPVVAVRALDDTVEGQAGVAPANFEVYLDRVATVPVTVEWRTRDGTALAGPDYRGTNGVAIVPIGGQRAPFQIEVTGDTQTEDDETLRIEIVRVTRGVAPVPIRDHLIRNDDPPLLLVSGASPLEVPEGRTALVRLRSSVSHLLGFALTAVSDGGTADPQSDYLPVRTNIVREGGLPADVLVPEVTVSDDVPEPDETVLIRLVDATGILLPADPAFTILIRDSSPRPSLVQSRSRSGSEPIGTP